MILRLILFPLWPGFFRMGPAGRLSAFWWRESIQKAVIFFGEIHILMRIRVVKIVVERKSGLADHREILPLNQALRVKEWWLTKHVQNYTLGLCGCNTHVHFC